MAESAALTNPIYYDSSEESSYEETNDESDMEDEPEQCMWQGYSVNR